MDYEGAEHMNVNLIENPGFEQVNQKWILQSTTSGNSCAYSPANARTGSHCMKLSSTLAGWSYIHQVVGLKAGKTYHLTFYAKRNSIDVWVASVSNGNWHHYPSLASQIGSEYTLIDQPITVTGNGIVQVTVHIIAGSMAGDAWIDNVSLMETIHDDEVSLYSNLVANGGFENSTGTWELDRAMIWSGDAYEGSHYVYFINNPNTGNPHAVRQWLDLEPGETYYLFYHVKRLGSMRIQPSIQYTKADGAVGYLYNPAPVSDSIYYVYSQQVYQFTLPATAQSGHVQLAMNVYGTVGESGYMKMDKVQVCGPKPLFQDGTLVEVYGLPSASPTLPVRPTAGTGHPYIGKLRNGTLAVCKGREVVNNQTWIKILWGGISNQYGYLLGDHVRDTYDIPGTKLDAAKKIAISMATEEYTGSAELGLTAAKWCVQYLSWLMKAVGCSSANYPGFTGQNASVQSAIQFFGTDYSLSTQKTPVAGDWVMYTTTGSAPADPAAYYRHVGLIVAVNGSILTTVEGNLSGTIKTPPSYNYETETHVGDNSFSVLGFATPTWA